MPKLKMPHLERLLSRTVTDENGCLVWTGTKDRHGYGLMKIDCKETLVHRAHYQLVLGSIPEETLDHLCCNRACINLDHLEPVSQKENLRRSWARRGGVGASSLTTCYRGHQYTREDLTRDKRGRKSCRACNKLAVKKYLAKKRLQQVGGE